MSSEPQLPGYSVDDDTHYDNDDTRNDIVTAEPERADHPVSAASAGDALPVPSTTTVSSQSPSILTQLRSTSPSQQEQEEQRPPAAAATAAAATASATSLPNPAVDEFADPKISQLHAIFPDFDAAIL
jgi:hypothetical protein